MGSEKGTSVTGRRSRAAGTNGKPAGDGVEQRHDVLALNAVCPYYTMFPLAFPTRILDNAVKGDWVFDPFCGRGSTNFAARVAGLPSIGIDSNPVAVAIARAKCVWTTPAEIVEACKTILGSQPPSDDVPHGEFWAHCFHPDTLNDLCRLRDALSKDCRSNVRQALVAFLLGRLHGPKNKTQLPSYFSNQMPRTYATKPGYSVSFWKRKQLQPPNVDVFDLVKRKVDRYFAALPEATKGLILEGDSRKVNLKEALRRASDRVRAPSIRWIVTSPPYYGMRTYIPDQWLRYWFLGGPSDVSYTCHSQLAHSSPTTFAQGLADVWKNAAVACADDAKLVVRFGGIPERAQRPRDILYESFAIADCGWRVVTARSSGEAKAHRRQSSQFFDNPAEQVEEYDVFARLE
jgi:hypothetical protein